VLTPFGSPPFRLEDKDRFAVSKAHPWAFGRLNALPVTTGTGGERGPTCSTRPAGEDSVNDLVFIRQQPPHTQTARQQNQERVAVHAVLRGVGRFRLKRLMCLVTD
jgi:hypothetical protein